MYSEVKVMARNKYPEKTRKAILDSAVRLFTIYGWEKVTIQEVIDDVGGITRGAFYHHFKSRKELIDAVTNEYFSNNKRVISLVEEKDSKAITRLKTGIIVSLEQQTTEGDLSNVPSVINSPEFVFRIVHDSINLSSKKIEKLIEQGNQDGSWEVKSVKELAESFTLLLNIWINPSIVTVEKPEYLSKVKFMDQFLVSFGIRLFDEELNEAFVAYYDALKK